MSLSLRQNCWKIRVFFCAHPVGCRGELYDVGVGVQQNDPNFGIRWLLLVTVIVDRHQQYPDFTL